MSTTEIKRRVPRGQIRKRPLEPEPETPTGGDTPRPEGANEANEDRQENAGDEEATPQLPEARPSRLPTSGPSVHRLEKRQRKVLSYEAGHDNEVFDSRAQQLATATTEQDSVTPEKSVNPTNRYGPMKAPNNVRVTQYVDYKPDVCKDYYETGYCSFGDSCKFAHIREDYKSGWQIEQEWQEEQKKKALRLQGLLGLEEEEPEPEPAGDNGIPWACFICRGPYKRPVVTRCRHYFCEECAIAHHRRSPRCACCDQPTMGIFNTAGIKMPAPPAGHRLGEQGDGDGDEAEGGGGGGGGAGGAETAPTDGGDGGEGGEEGGEAPSEEPPHAHGPGCSHHHHHHH
eukprot:TRINITY_DN54578_c0_g1_i1.p1 TRINITY_DN54578_c0_g1~~TRINITY_DN54578_c0_g1_i1.p1  ORF type:complete len:343 (-),score=61.28 TRINITY_DN54578_c0_g1_i1:35-1063(-)